MDERVEGNCDEFGSVVSITGMWLDFGRCMISACVVSSIVYQLQSRMRLLNRIPLARTNRTMHATHRQRLSSVTSNKNITLMKVQLVKTQSSDRGVTNTQPLPPEVCFVDFDFVEPILWFSLHSSLCIEDKVARMCEVIRCCVKERIRRSSGLALTKNI